MWGHWYPWAHLSVSRMSSMACRFLPESGSNLSAADELFQNQRSEQGIYWTLWDSRLSDDLNTTIAYSDNHGNNGGGAQSFDTSEHCSTVPSDSDEQPGYPSQFEPLHMEQTNDMFLSQFSDEEVRRMDAPFQALDMFPDSMHRLMSYEHMLSGALVSDSKNLEVNMDQDDMDTCGFPLYFSHGLQDDDDDQVKVDDGGLPSFAKGMVAADTSMDKAGASTTERGNPGSSPGFEEKAVLEELEEVMVQMARTTRICLRDAFYRLAEGSRPPRSAATAAGDGAAVAEPTSASSTRPRRRRDAIDRTVVSLTFRPPPCSPEAEAAMMRPTRA
uniref:Uncharacterized protein n=1 Tax=Oryza meridionalis TaxID=40149 RepID=A0A0E0C0V6_9ORYZ